MTDFTTFNIAKKLKEKGFREECFAYYTSEYTLYNNMVVLCDDKYLEVAEIDYTESLTSNNSVRENKYNNICDAPTISQVLKWLREKGVDIYCTPYWHNKTDKYYVVCIVKDRLYNYGAYIDDNDFNNYESATLAGIEYSLDNLI